jgi:hypothetical protein
MTSPGRFPVRSSDFSCAGLTGRRLARGIETLLHPLHVRSTACEQREGVNSLDTAIPAPVVLRTAHGVLGDRDPAIGTLDVRDAEHVDRPLRDRRRCSRLRWPSWTWKSWTVIWIVRSTPRTRSECTPSSRSRDGLLRQGPSTLPHQEGDYAGAGRGRRGGWRTAKERRHLVPWAQEAERIGVPAPDHRGGPGRGEARDERDVAVEVLRGREAPAPDQR